MRVAFVAESFLPSINGVTNSVLRMLEHLRAGGHEAVVIAPTDPRGVPDDYADFPVVTTPSVALPWYRDLRWSLATSHRLHHILADFSPDVVHLAAPVLLGRQGLLAATSLDLPTVALYQTEIPRYVARYGYPMAEPLAWRYLRAIHNRATLTLAPSSFTRAELAERGFTRVGIWGRGVDCQRFSPAHRDPELHRAWAPNGETIIGFMGRLGSEKRVRDLEVLVGIPGIRLVIVGDGPERAPLQAALPRAIFTGMQTGDELARQLASMDLFVHPGELETFGQAIQEAQASGLPVIAPRRGGPIDLVSPSHNGWLYPPGDLEAMRRAVLDLLGDRTKREAFGRTARQKVLNRSWSRLCGELLDHYQRAISLAHHPALAVHS